MEQRPEARQPSRKGDLEVHVTRKTSSAGQTVLIVRAVRPQRKTPAIPCCLAEHEVEKLVP